MATQVNRVTNCNVYINGSNFLGRASEVETPEIKHKLADHSALGLMAVMELFSGIDKMEAKITWNSFYADVLKVIADPTTTNEIQVRGSLETHTPQGKSGEVPVVIYMTAAAKNFPSANFKQNENVDLSTTFNVISYKLEIDGESIIEADVISNTLKINGDDKFANYRANLGI